ncbi:oxidoreductase [Pokkaliibacter plantistimulans]|uniref:Oxidoreductase n=1 Tax=Proteobacteria bacterium 228 TaxID=2083153 RepID=A0A2S5KPK2_9PROT|nr:NADH-quinone oxidoreductase subunit M [Pokkaliibacter plantistimulans]PPC76565.1 oxidoreductase [Pokkaliibacter plantistimulans]
MLNLVIYFPLLAAAAIWLGCRERGTLARSLTLAVICLETLILFGLAMGGNTLSLDAEWIADYGIHYHLQLDGLGLALSVLSGGLAVVAILVGWERIDRWQAFGPLLLATLSGMVGLFAAYDLILFYVFWELMLIPMYFMLAMWGDPDSRRSATQFMLVTVTASLLMLVAIILLFIAHGVQTGIYTFDYGILKQTPLIGNTLLSKLILAGLLLGFGVKVPVFPLHFWAPLAYRKGDPSVIIMLSGAMANAGVYGLLRFTMPLMPEVTAAFAPWGMAIGAIGTLYGAAQAIRQDDLRGVIAWSSISHMNIAILALFAWQAQALHGMALQLLAHGLSVAGLFAIAALLLDRKRDGVYANVGGLYAQMPKLGMCFLFFVVATVGMPGLANFAGEALILAGAISRSILWGSVGAVTILLSVIYGVKVYGKVMLGPVNPRVPTELWDLNSREKAALTVLIIAILVIGLMPQLMIETVHLPTAELLAVNIDSLFGGVHAID